MEGLYNLEFVQEQHLLGVLLSGSRESTAPPCHELESSSCFDSSSCAGATLEFVKRRSYSRVREKAAPPWSSWQAPRDRFSE